jgi:hypothetical protein
MPRPTGHEVTEFAFARIWEDVASVGVAERLNARAEFVTFLIAKGHPGIVAEEFAEKNTTLLLTNILKMCDQWEALGIPRPLDIVDQNGSIVTWKHPRFENITGRKPLSGLFCDVWNWVKNCHDRDFLFCCAAYLFSLGCTRIYITDTTGDAGLDLIGIIESEPFRGLCVVVQAKTAHGQIRKEDLFSDYTKFLLLKHDPKWDEYRKAASIDKAHDGVGILYIFASNCEFSQPIVQAARNLPIMLRSGRQIAHNLANRADAARWKIVRDHVGETNASLTRNIFKLVLEVL